MNSAPANHDEDDSKTRAHELSIALEKTYREIRELSDQVQGWQLPVGRGRAIRARLGSAHVAWLFGVFHFVVGVTGGVLAVVWDAGKELGIAMVVGALFGIGSFVSQWWAQAMETEREFLDKAFMHQHGKRLRELLDEEERLLADLRVPRRESND